MKKLVGLLLVAVIIVGAIIYKESTNYILNPNLNIKSINNISNSIQELKSVSNDEILTIVNKYGYYNFNKVLNKELSGSIMRVELENSNNSRNMYIGDLGVVNHKLVLEGNLENISNTESELLLSKGNRIGQSIDTISTNNKNNQYISATLKSDSIESKNIRIKSSDEATKFALSYYREENTNMHIKGLQGTFIVKQNIGDEKGYLVQLYNNKNNIAILLVTKNGEIYNANTDPLVKLN